MRILVAALYAAVTLIACSQREAAPPVPHAAPPTAKPTPPKPDPSDLGDGTALGAPVRFRNLTLVPIVATTAAIDDTDYLVLDEGMKSKQVKIRERDDADVNELTLTNRSARPLFVMTGEVVIGGQQDRIIGKNTIVPPHTTQAVPVFCVEHGRWSGRHADFASAGALAHQSLRTRAAFDSQGDVWDEVASKNAKRGLDRDNDTGTYRGAARAQTTLADWDAAFDRPPGARQVGYAVALGGEVVAVDEFGGPALFAKLDRKLRRSYYAEAQDAPEAEGARAPTAADVIAFLHRTDAVPEAKTYDTPEADTLDRIGDQAASSKVMTKPTGAARAKKVYESTTKYSKKEASAPQGDAKMFLEP
jgi:hypothetical protein